MNIVYLVFGKSIDNYQQVYFSIYTALLHKEDTDRIIVLAEDPSLFEHFGDRIEVIAITREQIKEWTSKYDYLFRIKIKGLQLVASKYPNNHLLFLDGDTFIYQDLSILKRGMDVGESFLHLNEGEISKMRDKSQKRMWSTLKNKTFCEILVNENTCMWNSGVIGIAKENLGALDLCLNLNDEMLDTGVVRRVIEQFAFSLALTKVSPLKPADHIVGHYWGNKEEWNKIIEDFLLRNFMKNSTLETILDEVSKMPLREYPIWTRHSNTQRKLKRFIDSFYKDRRAQFVK